MCIVGSDLVSRRFGGYGTSWRVCYIPSRYECRTSRRVLDNNICFEDHGDSWNRKSLHIYNAYDVSRMGVYAGAGGYWRSAGRSTKRCI